MRLLLDECVPRLLKHDLIGHDVSHVNDMGWSSKRNGELLRLMATERFDAFLTVDQSLEFQQNIRASGIGVVVAFAKTNRVKELRPLVPQILEALRRLRPGDLIYAVLSDGGEIFMLLEKTPFANRFAVLRDRFGASWMLLHQPAP